MALTRMAEPLPKESRPEAPRASAQAAKPMPQPGPMGTPPDARLAAS